MDTNSLESVTSLYGGYWNFDFQDSCYMTNSYFPPDEFIDLLVSNLRTLIQAYPSTNKQISSVLGEVIGIDGSKIVVGNGASELIAAVSTTLFTNVAMPVPTFEEYPNRAKLLGKQVSPYTLTGDFHLDTQKFVSHVQASGANSVMIVNPNNPTGTITTRDEMVDLLNKLSHLDLVLIDESFIEFSRVQPNPSVGDLIDEYPNLMIMKSMSKNYGVPGLRLGYIVSGNPSHVQKLREAVSIWSINSIGQAFLENLSKFQPQFLQSCEHVIASTQKLFQDLESIPDVTPYPTQGNYILCELGAGVTGHQAGTILLQQHGILISDRGNRSGMGPNFIRIASRTEEENERVVAALRTIFTAKEAQPAGRSGR